LDTERLVELIVRVLMSLVKSDVIEIKLHQPAAAASREARPPAATPAHSVVCLEDVCGKASCTLEATGGAVVTPSAQEYMRDHSITLRRV
jgi:hypothetical protein